MYITIGEKFSKQLRKMGLIIN